MQPKKTLIVPIEVTSRELDSRLAIIIDLLKLNPNWNIMLGISKKIKQFAREVYSKNYVLFENALNAGKLLEEYSKFNVKVIILDEEGGITTKYQEQSLPRMGYNNEGFNYIEKFFLWGQHNYNTIIKNHSNANKNKLIITGNPRFDLSRNYFNNFFKKFNPRKNFILLIFAFGTANNLVPLEIENSYYVNSNLPNEVKTRKVRILRAEYQKKLLQKYIEGIEKLVMQYPNENFVVRCHPLENEDIYKERFSKYKNVIVNTSGPIQEWLPECKLLVHNGCTTSIEGFFNGLEPICFMPLYDENHIQFLTYEISDKAHSEKELFDIFSKKIHKSYQWNSKQIASKKDSLRKIILNIDKEKNFSSEYIAKEIENIEVDYSEILSGKNILIKSIIQTLRNMKKFLNLRKYMIIRKMDHRFMIGIKGLEYSNIKKRIEHLSEEINFNGDIKTKEIQKGIFKIYI